MSEVRSESSPTPPLMATSVRRYGMVSCTSMGQAWQDIEEVEDGPYVEYTDYAALQQQLAEREARVAAADALLQRVSRVYSDFGILTTDLRSTIASHLAAALAPLDGKEQV